MTEAYTDVFTPSKEQESGLQWKFTSIYDTGEKSMFKRGRSDFLLHFIVVVFISSG